ncbi:transglutaminase superfamily protein [Flavobacteriaceae bacterium MAR_2010_105]|nr:transglutaminase superfamily protein [Flavobacteriaceae bacterium MAR_2010_105]
MKRALFVLLSLPLIAFSQDFSNEDYIYLKRHENIKIELSNHKFDIAKHVSEQAQYLTSKKLYFANEVMHFDSFTSIENVEAYTYLPKFDKKINVDYIETKREFDNGVFYSDQEAKHFTFPAVTEGAITNLNYTEVIKDPHFLGMFRFGTYVPTKHAQLSIEFPKNVTIGYIDFNTEGINLDFKKESLTDSNKYTWTVDNLKGFEGEEGSESVLYYLPHIIVYIKSYEENGKVHNVLNDTKDLYKWYASLVKQIDTNALEKVYAIADNVTKNISTKREKAEAIFNWVQNNITYVAFEDGLGGFIPRGAASVCDKRYGDCKDMANLLYEMLNHVGITSYRTWIGTRDRHYSYREVPTPIVDNHMINTVIIDNDTIFLDATDSYVPFGMPSAFTQTKEALLGIDDQTFKIITVPTQKPEQSLSKITSLMTLNDETLNVSEERQLTGYDKVDFISDYTFKKADKTEEEFLNTTLALGNNKTKYNNIKKTNFNNKNSPLVISYDLNIENYAKSIGGKYYVNLNIDRTLSQSNIDTKDRKYSKKIDHKFKKEFTTTFTIPDGFKASYIPEALSFEHPDYGFKISYSTEGSKVIQHKAIYVNTLSVKNKDFESWNDFIKSLIKAYKKSIIIEQL